MIGGGIIILAFILWIIHEVRNAPILNEIKNKNSFDNTND